MNDTTEVLQPHPNLDRDPLRRAKKMYKCSECSRAIEPKELYHRTYPRDGEAHNTCLLCETRAQARIHRDAAEDLNDWVENNAHS